MDFMDIFWAVIILGTIFGIGSYIYNSAKRDKKAKEIGAIERIEIGKYLIGLPNANLPIDHVECSITDSDFVFISLEGDELGRIQRNSVNQIFVEDKSQVSQRITVTRILTLGIFSLAAPKKNKHKEFCLVIDWDDSKGTKHNSIFEFSGLQSSLATEALNQLQKYKKRKIATLRVDEKKCPYCAETIKAGAIICRYCQSDLADSYSID